jgi:hypothetical protein
LAASVLHDLQNRIYAVCLYGFLGGANKYHTILPPDRICAVLLDVWGIWVPLTGDTLEGSSRIARLAVKNVRDWKKGNTQPASHDETRHESAVELARIHMFRKCRPVWRRLSR